MTSSSQFTVHSSQFRPAWGEIERHDSRLPAEPSGSLITAPQENCELSTVNCEPQADEGGPACW